MVGPENDQNVVEEERGHYVLSPLMRWANRMSLGMMVTCLALIAQTLESSKRPKVCFTGYLEMQVRLKSPGLSLSLTFGRAISRLAMLCSSDSGGSLSEPWYPAYIFFFFGCGTGTLAALQALIWACLSCWAAQ